MKKLWTGTLVLMVLMSLTGCMYPEERLSRNSVPYEDQIVAVQTAVDRYQKDNGGILPIKNRDMSTPIYRKYPINFNELVPGYMQDAPGTSFENGGNYQYVLVDVENDPKVKLIDLVMVEHIRELKLRLNMYVEENRYPPFGKPLAKNRYEINYEELGYKTPPYVVSPYSGKNLPLIFDNNAEVYVDYSIDLFDALNNYDHTYKNGDDIRGLLVDNSVFVPAFSVPYTVKDNEPVFLMEE